MLKYLLILSALVTACAGSTESFESGLTSRALAPPATDKHWVTTWASTLAEPGWLALLVPNISATTVRQVVHTSTGGTTFTERLSNQFGKKPLTIAAAHAALRDKADSIQPDTDRGITFTGASSVTIPPGGAVESDPIALTFAPFADLAISLDLPKGTTPSTAHLFSSQNNYIAQTQGNAGAQSLPSANVMGSWLFLDAIHVEAPEHVNTIVCFGDSITDGAGSTADQNRRWPDQLARRLAEAEKPYSIANRGYSGNQLLVDSYGLAGLRRFQADVLDTPGMSHVIVVLGINDIGDSSATSDQLIAGYTQLIDAAHQAQRKIILGTLTPFEGASYFSETGEETRSTVNQWMRSNADIDGLIDFDATLRDPAAPRRVQAKFDGGDHIHPNDAGYIAMGDAVELQLFD